VPLAFALLATAQSSGLPPEILLLSKIKRQAKQDLSRIPNFTCLETIERTSRTSESKPFSAVDVVLVEVAHVGDRELFAWPGASHFESADLSPMIGSGLASNGEFVSHARSVFVGEYGVIRYAGIEEVRGRPAARYDYQISPAFSGYTVHNAGRASLIGVKGSFWADSSTVDLLRLTAVGTAIPVGLGVRLVSTVLDYGRVRIGTSDYLLPQAATVQIALDTGVEQRNRIEFTHCRQYSTESVLSFADPDMKGPDAPAIGRVVEVFLPPDLIVTAGLETPIPLAHAKIGDAISTVLDSDLKQKGRLIAPKGAVISGRLRLLQREKSGYTVGLEFTDMTFENGHARFLAKLASVDSRYAQSVQEEAAPEPTHGSRILLDLPMALPGVATFFVPDRVSELPKGLRMQWRTIAAGK
jgi:hypothetical protein